jgi:hypothetical protein
MASGVMMAMTMGSLWTLLTLVATSSFYISYFRSSIEFGTYINHYI